MIARASGSNITLIDPGISWTGLVPSHWTRSRHSVVLHEVKQLAGDEAETETLLSLTKHGVIPRDVTEGKGKFPASFDTYQLVDNDQLVFCLFDVDETPRTVGLAHERGIVTGAYDVFEVNTSIADPRYLEYYFIGIDNEKRFRPLYTGLRKVIQKPRFKSAPIMLPPLDEQRAIADFLVRETQRIDALMAEQRGLIETLRERKRSVVDRGAEKAGVGRTRLRHLFEPSDARNYPNEQILSVYREYGVIPKGSRDGNRNVTPEDVSRYLLVRPGDLVVNRMKAWQGSLGVSDHQGIVSGDYEVLQPTDNRLLPRFSHLYLRSARMVGEYAVRSTGIRPSQWRLYWKQMADIEIPVPSLQKQQEIVTFVEDQTSGIDALISESEDLIALSLERRSALITAAVTGQTDVRTEA